MDLEPDQLKHAVRQLFGTTPGKLITHVRIYEAAKQLRKGRQSIKEITYNSGFAEPAVFCAAFKSVFRCTPTQYREHFQPTQRPNFRWQVPLSENRLSELIELARWHDWLAALLRISSHNLYNKRFGVPDLASKLNISAVQLNRRMKRLLNTSPGRFIRELRLCHAAEDKCSKRLRASSRT